MNAKEQNKRREDIEKKDQYYEKYNNRFDNRPLILRILTKK